MSYATRSDIELIFGKANVIKWADVDNNNNKLDILDRITWALESATAFFDNRLRRGPYVIPFVDDLDLEVVNHCARLAGVMLYESRGYEDTENTDGSHKLSPHRRIVNHFIAGVLSGRISIAGERQVNNLPATSQYE